MYCVGALSARPIVCMARASIVWHLYSLSPFCAPTYTTAFIAISIHVKPATAYEVVKTCRWPPYSDQHLALASK
jgi:hypothetical protein